MYVAEADKMRLGNVPRADTTPEEDAEGDETKRDHCVYQGRSALRTTRVKCLEQVRVSFICRYAAEFVTEDAATYDEKDSALYSPSSKPSISRSYCTATQSKESFSRYQDTDLLWISCNIQRTGDKQFSVFIFSRSPRVWHPLSLHASCVLQSPHAPYTNLFIADIGIKLG